MAARAGILVKDLQATEPGRRSKDGSRPGLDLKQQQVRVQKTLSEKVFSWGNKTVLHVWTYGKGLFLNQTGEGSHTHTSAT